MKKVSKAILIALGVVLLAVALAVLCVNLYIQSAGTQARIQEALSRLLRTPVKVSGASYMPWTGLQLTGIASTEISPADGQPLQIARVKARVHMFKLLRRKVVVKELTIDGAKVTWNETTAGLWHGPAPTAPVENEIPSGTAAPMVPQPPPAQPVPVEPAPSPETPRTPAPPPVVMLNHFRLRDAAFDFYDNNHRHIASVEGINVDSRYPKAESVNGTASMTLVTIQNMFYMRDWRASFTYTPEEFSLRNAVSSIAGGASTGNFSVKIGEPDAPFDIDVKFSGIDIEHLIADAGLTRLEASGSLAGSLRLQGDLRSSNSAKGQGRFAITNGRVMQWDPLRTLGQVLHNENLQQITFSDAFANYHVLEGRVILDELVLKSPVMMLTGQGIAEISGGAIAMKARLTISADIARQIPDFLLDGFGKDASDARFIDFNVYGTLDNPKTDLVRLIGKSMDYKRLEKGAGSILKSLLGGKSKVPRPAPAAPRQQPAQQPPVPTPSESPATP